MWLTLLYGDKNEVNVTIQVLKDVDGDEKEVLTNTYCKLQSQWEVQVSSSKIYRQKQWSLRDNEEWWSTTSDAKGGLF